MVSLVPGQRIAHVSESAWVDEVLRQMREQRLHLGLVHDEHHESTVGGYLSEQLGRVPAVGETVDCHGWKAEILAVEETRITSLSLHKRDEPQSS